MSVDAISTNPVRIESDDEGIRLVIDISEMGMELLGAAQRPAIAGTLDITAAFELYEHVRDTLAAFYAEATSARRAVARGVTLDEYIGRNRADAVDSLLAAGDQRRKATRENGPDRHDERR